MPPLLKSIESGNFFFQPRRLHLQPADLLVQLSNQGVLVLHLATLVAGEQLRRAVEQLLFPLSDLCGMDTELASQFTCRSIPSHRRQRRLGLQGRLDPSPLRSHAFLRELDQSSQGFDSKSWSSFLGPL